MTNTVYYDKLVELVNEYGKFDNNGDGILDTYIHNELGNFAGDTGSGFHKNLAAYLKSNSSSMLTVTNNPQHELIFSVSDTLRLNNIISTNLSTYNNLMKYKNQINNIHDDFTNDVDVFDSGYTLLDEIRPIFRQFKTHYQEAKYAYRPKFIFIKFLKYFYSICYYKLTYDIIDNYYELLYSSSSANTGVLKDIQDDISSIKSLSGITLSDTTTSVNLNNINSISISSISSLKNDTFSYNIDTIQTLINTINRDLITADYTISYTDTSGNTLTKNLNEFINTDISSINGSGSTLTYYNDDYNRVNKAELTEADMIQLLTNFDSINSDNQAKFQKYFQLKSLSMLLVNFKTALENINANLAVLSSKKHEIFNTVLNSNISLTDESHRFQNHEYKNHYMANKNKLGSLNTSIKTNKDNIQENESEKTVISMNNRINDYLLYTTIVIVVVALIIIGLSIGDNNKGSVYLGYLVGMLSLYYAVFILIQYLYIYKEGFTSSVTEDDFNAFNSKLAEYIQNIYVFLLHASADSLYFEHVNPAMEKELNKFKNINLVTNMKSKTSKQQNNVMQHDTNYKQIICQMMIAYLLWCIIVYMLMERYPNELYYIYTFGLLSLVLITGYFVFSLYNRTRTTYKKRDWVKPKFNKDF